MCFSFVFFFVVCVDVLLKCDFFYKGFLRILLHFSKLIYLDYPYACFDIFYSLEISLMLKFIKIYTINLNKGISFFSLDNIHKKNIKTKILIVQK